VAVIGRPARSVLLRKTGFGRVMEAVIGGGA